MQGHLETFSPSIRQPMPGTKAQAILTLAACTPATPPEIADTVNTSRQHVHQVLARYGVEPNRIASFKEHRADILAGITERILATVDEETIKDASLLQRVTSAGILTDKERLERGLSQGDTLTVQVAISQVRALSISQISTGIPQAEAKVTECIDI